MTTKIITKEFTTPQRYLQTMPFKANITVHAWGAGGGGGGMDAGTLGGVGAPGLYNTTTFQVQKDDILEVIVGTGGSGGGSNAPSAPGGQPGASRININNDVAQSFNGGAGSLAGPTPYSGAGGGGGGASAILVNNSPVLVAAGGGGGGGAGNDGNGSSQYARRDASINNNSMLQQIIVHSSNYNINRRDWDAYYFLLAGNRYSSIDRGHNLAVINPATLQLESYSVYDTWAYPSNSSFTAALNAVTTGKIIILLAADACALSSTARSILQSKYGSTQTATWGNLRRSHAFIGIAGGSFTPLEAFSDSSTVDISKVISGVIATDFRGENGQSKGGDGGGAGGGGGGYPGGQGGSVYPGDASGYAGQCGGNLPVYAATTGQNTPYYKTGFAAGGDRGSGNGQNGRVLLLIEPLSIAAVKVSGEWKQIQEAFVKVSGTWKDIETIYIKVDDSWKIVSGAGQRDIQLTANVQSYGTSTRSYS